jgi:hypothetical protein
MAILFILLAAILKAVADVTSHHFETSVFKWKDPRWWNPAISWQYVGFIKFTKYRPDCWHLANSGMIICFCLATVFHTPVLKWYLELPIAGVLFNVAFNIFYNKILRNEATTTSVRLPET